MRVQSDAGWCGKNHLRGCHGANTSTSKIEAAGPGAASPAQGLPNYLLASHQKPKASEWKTGLTDVGKLFIGV